MFMKQQTISYFEMSFFRQHNNHPIMRLGQSINYFNLLKDLLVITEKMDLSQFDHFI